MTNDLKSALTIVYGDIVAVNGKADTNATNIESNTSNIETLQREVATNTSQLSTNTSNIETLQQEVANLKASASGVLYNESVESGVGYELSVSENALPYGTMDIVGGMSYKSENLLTLSDIAETTTNDITYSVENGVITLNGTASQATYLNLASFTLSAGTYYLKAFGNNAGSYQTYFALLQDSSLQNIAFCYDSTTSVSFTLSETTTLNYVIVIRNAISITDIQFKDMVVSGSTAPTTYQPYFEGIRNTPITSVVSKDSNDNLLATGEIPSEIQALTGYGWGISQSVCNYIDFENKKFIQKVYELEIDSAIGNIWYSSTFNAITLNNTTLGANVGSIIFYSTNTNIASVSLTSGGNIYIVFTNAYSSYTEMRQSINGTIVYYELAEPIETDISSYITDNTMQFGAGGTITLNNDYEQAVPYQYTILEKVSE